MVKLCKPANRVRAKVRIGIKRLGLGIKWLD